MRSLCREDARNHDDGNLGRAHVAAEDSDEIQAGDFRHMEVEMISRTFGALSLPTICHCAQLCHEQWAPWADGSDHYSTKIPASCAREMDF